MGLRRRGPEPAARSSSSSTTSTRTRTPTRRRTGASSPVDLAFAEVEVERYQALIIPGGRAPEYIRTDPDVRRITEWFFAKDLPVGTICHGPQVPAVYGLLQGRRPPRSRR